MIVGCFLPPESKTYRIMNDIIGKRKWCISSKTTGSHIATKTNLNVCSLYMEERDAFLCTAKRNATLMFSKYLGC